MFGVLRSVSVRFAAPIVVLAVLALSCAPTYHRVERLRFNHVEAGTVESAAAGACQNPNAPTRPFVTDGCTLWPDGWWTGRSWQKCCIDHDAAYWCGGTNAKRKQADKDLCDCVAQEYSAWMGSVMWLGSRLGGHRLVPAHWRWGYGHDYPAP